jgi:hypothetical protein
MGAKVRAKATREEAQKAARAADRAEAASMVGSDGRLWWTGAAFDSHRPVHQWRARLARSRVQALQDPSEAYRSMPSGDPAIRR